MKTLGNLLLGLFVLTLLAVPLVTAQAQGLTVTAQVVASLRDGPSRSSKVIAPLAQGQSVPAIGRTDDKSWIQVVAKDKTGWVMARQVKINGDVNTLPVTSGQPNSGNTAPQPTASAPNAAPTAAAVRRTVKISETLLKRVLAGPTIQNVNIVPNQIVLTVNGKFNGTPTILTFYFGVMVVDGKLAAVLSALGHDGQIDQAANLAQDSVAQANDAFSKVLNVLVRNRIGNRTIVEVAVNQGEIVVNYQ